MKVAVALCLLACVAASQAAFSGNLVERAQPLLNQALFKVRLVTRSSSGIQTEIIAQLQEQANLILGQIQAGIELGEQVIAGLVQQFQQVQDQIQGLLGQVTEGAGGIIAGILEGLGSIWGSIFGKRVAQKGIFDFLDNFNWEAIKQYILQLIGTVDMAHLLQQVLAHFPSVPAWVVEFILNQVNSLGSSKGMFDGILEWISGGAAALWQQVADLAQQLLGQAAASFAQVQALAQQFLEASLIAGEGIASQAQQQLLEFLRPYAADLGHLWTQIEAQISGMGAQLGLGN